MSAKIVKAQLALLAKASGAQETTPAEHKVKKDRKRRRAAAQADAADPETIKWACSASGSCLSCIWRNTCWYRQRNLEYFKATAPYPSAAA